MTPPRITGARRLLRVPVLAPVLTVTLGLAALAPAPAGAADTGSISGTVTDSAGVPLEDICVSGFDDGDGDYYDFTQTAPNGSYSLTGFGSADFLVNFQVCDGQNLVGEWYDDQPDYSSATQVPVVDGAETSGIDAELAPGASIAGTVTDETGASLEAVCVSVFDEEYDYVGDAYTDEVGLYEANGLPGGDLRVQFRDCGGNNALPEWYDDKPSFDAANPVSVAPGGSTSGVDAELAPGASVSGTVTRATGGPASDVCIDVYDEDYDYASYAYTDSQGRYTATSLPAGTYKIEFYDCGDSDVRLADQWYANKKNFSTATPVVVGAQATVDGIDASLVDARSIKGTVRSEAGAPLSDVCVDVYDSSYEYVTGGYTREDGTYATGDLEPGTYKVEFEDCGGYGLESEWWDDQFNFATATPVTMPSSGSRTGIDAKLSMNGPDRTAPDTVVTAGPADGSTVSTPAVTFGFVGTPASDTASFECQVDGRAFTVCTSPNTVSGLANGPHTFSVRAVDASGNRDQTPASRTFTVAVPTPTTTPPTATPPTSTAGCTQAQAGQSKAQQAVTKAAKAQKKKTAGLKKAKGQLKKAEKAGKPIKAKQAKVEKAAKKVKAAKKKVKSAKSQLATAKADVAESC